MSFLPKICVVVLIVLRMFESVSEDKATHHDELAGDVLDAVEAVVVLAVAESMRVDVGGEVADGGLDAFVEGGAEGEMAAETHAGGALWRWLVVLSGLGNSYIRTYCEMQLV